MSGAKRAKAFFQIALAVTLLAQQLPIYCQPMPPVELKPALPEGERQLDLDSDEYTLGPGDILSITDMTSSTDGRPLTSTAPVLPDGSVSIFPVGLIKASGKTLRSLEQEVRQRYAAIAKSPDFVLGVAQTRPVEVYVLGEVANPGRYRSDKDRDGQLMLSAVPFSGPTAQATPAAPQRSQAVDFLLPFSPVAAAGAAAIGVGNRPPVPQAAGGRTRYGDTARILSPTTMTAITALQLAGGVKETADIRHVVVRRRNHPPVTLDLWALLVEGDASQDVVLKPDDVVLVPKGATTFQAEALGLSASQSRVIKVFGAVRQPGIYELAPQDDVLSIVSRAGGFTDTAIQRKVWLGKKMPGGHYSRLKVSIQKSMRRPDYIGRAPLASGDVLEVKESLVKRIAPRVLTIGGAFVSAFMILYFSRRIVDRSQPQQAAGTVNLNNAGPLGLPSVF